MLDLPLLEYPVRTHVENGRAQVFDPIRKRWLAMTPEEHVRQRLIQYFTEKMLYPQSMMAVEKSITIGPVTRRFDLALYRRDTHQPWLLAECKAPDMPIDAQALYQLVHYHSQLQCRFWLLTNGHQHFCADVDDANNIQWLDALPAYDF